MARIPKRYLYIAAALFIIGLYFTTFRERTIAFSYDSTTCDKQAVLFPDISHTQPDSKYDVSAEGGWKVAGVHVMATSLCMHPKVAPVENEVQKVSFSPWGGWFMRYTYALESNKLPEIALDRLKEPIPPRSSLSLPLSVSDQTFTYQITVKGRTIECAVNTDRITCDIPSLNLEPQKTYKATFDRLFNKELVGEVATTDLITLSPVTVMSTSIQQDATVYDKPQMVDIIVDKAISRAEFVVEQINTKTPTKIAAKTSVADKKITVSFDTELPREAKLQVRATTLEAYDGSTTKSPYQLTFTTSGGPKVVGINAGSSGVFIGTQVAVTFDQPLDTDQDIGKIIRTSGGVVYTGHKGNQLYFSTASATRCGDLSISVTGNISSKYGVTGEENWGWRGRASCYTLSTIGYSLQGRSINAYYFGGGGTTILYVGAIHGNEPSSKYILEDWIDELNANPGRIPSGKQIVVVPSLNPDGIAAGSRNNSRGVNLDRNFPTDDWMTDIHSADGFRKGGGGSAPLSEPESKAIAALVQHIRPRMMLSYHSQGSLVMGDPGMISQTYATRYASMVGYRDATNASSEETFGYDGSSGLFEGWAVLKVGVPNIVVELSGHHVREFSRHREAFWAMLQ